MHIRRIVVARYGPLKPLDETLSAFTVIHGPNERGKTLIVDALVRMFYKDELKRSHYKLFGNITRVDERPEGFVVMATHAGETKIGAEESISDVAPVAISPEDFRNVFLIRDSDLALSNEEAYYGRVSERLCGTRSTAIERLKEVLKRIGRLRSATPDSPITIRKDRDQKRIGEQVVAAEKLLDEIIALGIAVEKEEFDVSYRRLADLAERREQLETEHRRRRDALTRARLEKARIAVSAVRENEAALSALEAASEGRLDEWRGLDVRREMLEKDLADVTARGEALRAARDEAHSGWDAMRASVAEKESLVARAATELRPMIDDWTRAHTLHAHGDRSSRAVVAVMVATIVLGVLALVTALATRSPIAIGAAFACAAGAAWCGFTLWRAAQDRTRLAKSGSEIVSAASRLGFGVASVPEAGEALDAMEQDVTQAAARARELEVLFRQRESDAAANESAAAEKRERMAEVERAREALRDTAGFESVERLAEAVARRRALEGGIDTQLALLRGWIPSAARHVDRGAFLNACEREIARGLETPADPADDDPDTAARVERELEQVVADEQETRRKVERTRQELRRIEDRITQLGVIEAPVHCRTSRELADAQRRIREFCETVERDARLAKEAIRILQEIEAEENERVGELFGEATLVSRWFREITGGRYHAVHLEDGEVVVELADGRRLGASALSGGAFDQLYLAIRASIAERMLPDAKGFFILDDPFLKADRDRLKALMKMLRQFVTRGWQVIYITAKDEVVESLRADIAAGTVQLIELERSLFARSPARPAAELTDAPRLL